MPSHTGVWTWMHLSRAMLIFPGDVCGRWMRARSSQEDGAAETSVAENWALHHAYSLPCYTFSRTSYSWILHLTHLEHYSLFLTQLITCPSEYVLLFFSLFIQLMFFSEKSLSSPNDFHPQTIYSEPHVIYMTIIFYKTLSFPVCFYGQLSKTRTVLIPCLYSALHNTLPPAFINTVCSLMEQAQN